MQRGKTLCALHSTLSRHLGVGIPVRHRAALCIRRPRDVRRHFQLGGHLAGAQRGRLVHLIPAKANVATAVGGGSSGRRRRKLRCCWPGCHAADRVGFPVRIIWQHHSLLGEAQQLGQALARLADDRAGTRPAAPGPTPTAEQLSSALGPAGSGRPRHEWRRSAEPQAGGR